jgi:hypothetical protein
MGLRARTKRKAAFIGLTTFDILHRLVHIKPKRHFTDAPRPALSVHSGSACRLPSASLASVW